MRTACEPLLSMACGTRDFQHSMRKAATKRWRLTISTNVRRLCKLLANCEFALRESDLFRSSEPKESNALNACNVKWPVYSTGCCKKLECRKLKAGILRGVYIVPVRVSFRYEFIPVPTCSSIFLYMIPVQNLIPVRVIPVRVHSGSRTGTRRSYRYEIWRNISNTRTSVWLCFQTPRTEVEKRGAAEKTKENEGESLANLCKCVGGHVGRGSCELGILLSDLVRELRNNKCMGNPDLLSVKEVKRRYLERVFVYQCCACSG